MSGVAQADHDQGSSKHESALSGARVIISTLSTVYLHSIYTVSTQYLHTVGTLQFQNIAIGHTATLLPRPLPNFSQWTMKGRHRGQKLKYSKYDLLNVEMIECPRAAKTSPGTISFQWFIPEAVNMYSYSCLLINCQYFTFITKNTQQKESIFLHHMFNFLAFMICE